MIWLLTVQLFSANGDFQLVEIRQADEMLCRLNEQVLTRQFEAAMPDGVVITSCDREGRA